jgi:hypothetical protein
MIDYSAMLRKYDCIAVEIPAKSQRRRITDGTASPSKPNLLP